MSRPKVNSDSLQIVGGGGGGGDQYMTNSEVNQYNHLQDNLSSQDQIGMFSFINQKFNTFHSKNNELQEKDSIYMHKQSNANSQNTSHNQSPINQQNQFYSFNQYQSGRQSQCSQQSIPYNPSSSLQTFGNASNQRKERESSYTQIEGTHRQTQHHRYNSDASVVTPTIKTAQSEFASQHFLAHQGTQQNQNMKASNPINNNQGNSYQQNQQSNFNQNNSNQAFNKSDSMTGNQMNSNYNQFERTNNFGQDQSDYKPNQFYNHMRSNSLHQYYQQNQIQENEDNLIGIHQQNQPFYFHNQQKNNQSQAKNFENQINQQDRFQQQQKQQAIVNHQNQLRQDQFNQEQEKQQSEQISQNPQYTQHMSNYQSNNYQNQINYHSSSQKKQQRYLSQQSQQQQSQQYYQSQQNQQKQYQQQQQQMQIQQTQQQFLQSQQQIFIQQQPQQQFLQQQKQSEQYQSQQQFQPQEKQSQQQLSQQMQQQQKQQSFQLSLQQQKQQAQQQVYQNSSQVNTQQSSNVGKQEKQYISIDKYQLSSINSNRNNQSNSLYFISPRSDSAFFNQNNNSMQSQQGVFQINTQKVNDQKQNNNQQLSSNNHNNSSQNNNSIWVETDFVKDSSRRINQELSPEDEFLIKFKKMKNNQFLNRPLSNNQDLRKKQNNYQPNAENDLNFTDNILNNPQISLNDQSNQRINLSNNSYQTGITIHTNSNNNILLSRKASKKNNYINYQTHSKRKCDLANTSGKKDSVQNDNSLILTKNNNLDSIPHQIGSLMHPSGVTEQQSQMNTITQEINGGKNMSKYDEVQVFTHSINKANNNNNKINQNINNTNNNTNLGVNMQNNNSNNNNYNINNNDNNSNMGINMSNNKNFQNSNNFKQHENQNQIANPLSMRNNKNANLQNSNQSNHLHVIKRAESSFNSPNPKVSQTVQSNSINSISLNHNNSISKKDLQQFSKHKDTLGRSQSAGLVNKKKIFNQQTYYNTPNIQKEIKTLQNSPNLMQNETFQIDNKVHQTKQRIFSESNSIKINKPIFQNHLKIKKIDLTNDQVQVLKQDEENLKKYIQLQNQIDKNKQIEDKKTKTEDSKSINLSNYKDLRNNSKEYLLNFNKSKIDENQYKIPNSKDFQLSQNQEKSLKKTAAEYLIQKSSNQQPYNNIQNISGFTPQHILNRNQPKYSQINLYNNQVNQKAVSTLPNNYDSRTKITKY